ncbi:MAG: prepilin peptidase [Candidatus Pacebacteria bacterium]|nr:prepilin peptidase [Candidatus Paceibacterota bacterium]
MDLLSLALIFVFGTIIGSFLNVVIYRYNSGSSPLKGRSQCFSCAKTLHWYELVPIVSFLIQGGRCRGCHAKISWQYITVEILSGIIFVSVFLLGKKPLETAYLLTIFSTLLVIGVYDLRHQIIPDGLVAFFALLSLAWFLWTMHLGLGLSEMFRYPFIWELLAGPILFFPFWALWAISRGKWIGLGDGKLAIGIGWFLASPLGGATPGGSAIMLAFWIGAFWALGIIFGQKVVPLFRWKGRTTHLSMKSEIPFGPFLILAVFVVYFTHINFFDGSITFFTFL